MKREILKKLKEGVKLTPEEIDVISKEFTRERKYGLVWEDHPEGVDLELKDGVFKIEDLRDKKISMDPNGRENLLLEGDNLHSLMALKEAGVEVHVIYIDPPYNTLNETGFKYNDKMVDENDSYRHSKWLSFMSKRLELARDLLTDDGVIFVSIDDNEQANLKLLMDKVFGEENFIVNMIRRENSKKQKIGKPNLKIEHEYVLVYQKDRKYSPFRYIKQKTYTDYNTFALQLLDELEKYCSKDEALLLFNDIIKGDFENLLSNQDLEISKIITLYNKLAEISAIQKGLKQYKFIDAKGLYRNADIAMYLGNGNYYNIINPFTKKALKNPKKGLPDKSKFLDTGLFKENKDGDLIFTNLNNIKVIEKNKNGIHRYSYGFISFKEDTIIDYIYYLDEYNSPSSIISDFQGTDARLVEKIGVSFDYPKRTDFIKYLISFIDNKNTTILDFFAGSGTTGQAVMELNKEDSGNRRFILCTNNENNICKEVTYERNKRVITGEYTGEKAEPLPNNLSYYKVDIENIDNLNVYEKKEFDNYRNIVQILWKNDYKIVNEEREFIEVRNLDENSIIIKLDTIDEGFRDSIDLNKFNKIYAKKHLSREKSFKGIDESKLIFY